VLVVAVNLRGAAWRGGRSRWSCVTRYCTCRCRAIRRQAGRHAVTALRVDAFISRLRRRPSAPAADRPETPNDTKDAWHDDDDASSPSPYFRLINYWRRQNAAEPSRCYRLAVKTDWLCISTRFESPAVLFCSHIRDANAAYGNQCWFCSRCYRIR